MNQRMAGESMASHQLLGRVQEVERVGGGRRVEHDQVVARVLAHGVQLLHRHVLLRAGERRGDVLVQAVVEDALGALGRRGVALDQLVEGALGVEHHRAQTCPAPSSPALRRTARAPPAAPRWSSPSRPMLLARRLAGSMVRHSTRLPMHGRVQRERRRGRGLADAAASRRRPPRDVWRPRRDRLMRPLGLARAAHLPAPRSGQLRALRRSARPAPFSSMCSAISQPHVDGHAQLLLVRSSSSM